jgi:protein TonB
MKHLFVVPTAGSILFLLLLLMVQLAGLNKPLLKNEPLFLSSPSFDTSNMSFAPTPAIDIATPQVLTPSFDEATAEQPPAMDVSAIEADSPLAQLLENIELNDPIVEPVVDMLDVSLQVDVVNDFLDGIAIAKPKVQKTTKVKKVTKTKTVVKKLTPTAAKVPAKSAQEQSVAKGAVSKSRSATPISRVKPRYPSRAKKRGIEGVVVVSFVVNKNGSVNSQSIRIVRANPAKIFNKSVRRALVKWKFSPVDKEYRTQYTLDFSLKK